jgi:glucuronate isomerase
VLCGLLGRDVERGELPDQDDLTGRLVEDICYRNAARYFGWEG